MNSAVKNLYEIMLMEDIIYVDQELIGDCIEIEVCFMDKYGSNRYFVTTLEPTSYSFVESGSRMKE